MRKGAERIDWTTAEIRFLADAAGRLPAKEISRQLERSLPSVRMQAARMNLSLRCYKPQLVWCTECASWRSHLDEETGKCRVCRKRDQLMCREAACAETLALMPPGKREVYAATEAARHTRKIPERPKARKKEGGRYERDKAEAEHMLALEEWEHSCLKLQYDAAKMRLVRMRRVIGTNPRKNLNQ